MPVSADRADAQTPAPRHQGTARREYQTLNAVRGVAAIAVMLYHGGDMLGQMPAQGYCAVDLFFALSGFVVAHAYRERLAGGLGVRAFTVARLIRFWPLYALGLGFGLGREALLVATGNPYALSPVQLGGTVAAGLLLLPFPLAQRDGRLFPANIPSWSLFFELAVNVVYALVRPALGPAMLVATIAAAAAGLVLLMPATGIEEAGVAIGSVPAGWARTILSFAIGLLIERVRPRAPRFPVPLLLVLTAAALICPWGGFAYDLAFVLLFSPAIVILGAGIEPPVRWIAAARWLGFMSPSTPCIAPCSHWPTRSAGALRCRPR